MLNAMKEPNVTTGAGEDPRVRMIVDTDEIVRRAVMLRAFRESARSRRKVSNSEIVTQLLRESLAAEIEELRGDDPEPPPKVRKKPGRKPRNP